MKKKIHAQHEVNDEKRVLSLKEMRKEYQTRPKTKFLWSGIKEKSFGLVFGPSKSGKTIFCENLGMSIAMGNSIFFGYELDGKEKKVLFIGLEEFWEARIERNLKQAEVLSEAESLLLDEYYLYQKIDFSKTITNPKQWKELKDTIIESKAEVVFIDSITRLNHANLDDSATAEKIMQRLRAICYELRITLICIHHTPKMEGRPITMDCIKGSSTFAQESDFAIGINKTTKQGRYLKNVFFRYAPDNDEHVMEFSINESTWLDYLGNVEEDDILKRTDRRIDNSKRDFILNYFNSNPNQSFKTNELIPYFKENLSIEERQIKSYLSSLLNDQKLRQVKKGYYQSISFKRFEDNK